MEAEYVDEIDQLKETRENAIRKVEAEYKKQVTSLKQEVTLKTTTVCKEILPFCC